MSKPGFHKPFPPLMGDAQSSRSAEYPAALEGENHSVPSQAAPSDNKDAEACAPRKSGAKPVPDSAADNSSAMHPSLAASLEAAIRMRHARENEARGGTNETGGFETEGAEATIADTPDAEITYSEAGAFGVGDADAEPADKEEDGEDEEDDDDDDEEGTMSLRDHLRELRKRVVRSFLLTLLGFFFCYPFAEKIYGYLLIPLLEVMPPDSMLIYTSVPEAFFTYLKVAFFVGIFAASPLIFYQMWAFIAPGLYREEKLYIVPVAVMSGVCFIGGGAFCFFVVFPIAFEFFMGYNVGRIQAMPSLKEYLSFVLQLIFAFGLVFEMPLFIFFLARLSLVTAPMLRKFRRYMILICFIVAAILTPPDVLSQLLMAGPMILLYEVSIFLAAAFGKKTITPAEDTEEDEEDGDEDDEEEDDNVTNKDGAGEDARSNEEKAKGLNVDMA